MYVSNVGMRSDCQKLPVVPFFFINFHDICLKKLFFKFMIQYPLCICRLLGIKVSVDVMRLIFLTYFLADYL